MPALGMLCEPIAADLQKVCQIFDDELFSDLPVVNELCQQVRRYRGKMLRPALLLLSARACGRVTDEHLTLAAVVEMVHMATLVHDDVLDDADLRRMHPTIRRLQGNEAAILLGDYLISHAYHLCSSLESQYASRLIASTTNVVCEGELQQIHHRGDDDLTLEQYLSIITRKTAALTGACCRLGAHCAGAEPRVQEALERYGMDVGIAFQMTDDILDIIGTEERMGKTLGRDLDKHKLTLPLIHCLGESAPEVRRQIKACLGAEHPQRDLLARWLQSTDSIGYALRSARKYVDSAVSSLKLLPSTDARESLRQMALMILEREQ